RAVRPGTYSGTARTRPLPLRLEYYDVDATSTSHQRHGWDIHALRADAEHESRATAVCHEHRNTRGTLDTRRHRKPVATGPIRLAASSHGSPAGSAAAAAAARADRRARPAAGGPGGGHRRPAAASHRPGRRGRLRLGLAAGVGRPALSHPGPPGRGPAA